MYTGNLAAVTNRETWTFLIEVIDPLTNEPFDIDELTAIQLAVRGPTSSSPDIVASLSDGRIVQVGDSEDGTVRVTVPDSEMNKLAAGSYAVGIRLTSTTGQKTQLLVGNLPVLDGVVDP